MMSLISTNIGSDDGLLPDGTKALPALILTFYDGVSGLG